MSGLNFDFDAAPDEDFFGTLKGKSSKLQHLFGEDVLPQDETQHSLKYKRPKATDLNQTPNKIETTPSTSASAQQSFTLIAKVVTAYKQGELQGKVGVALIKNTDESINILIYKSKTHILVTLTLLPDQQVLFKQNNYWQFYDELGTYWSLSFENHQDEADFRDKLLSSGHRLKQTEQQEAKQNKEPLSTESSNENSPNLKMEEMRNLDLPQLPTKDVTKETKNALIKRMAKMGQPLPILPTTSLQTTSEFSDSSTSDAEVINMPLPQKPTIAPKANKLATLKSNQQLVSSYNSVIYPTTNAALESQYMQMLLTEQRTQGSELRMNMNKLENKIEKVMDKLDLFDRVGAGDSKVKIHKDDEILELEEKILNLKKENRKLKQLAEQRTEQETYEAKSKQIVNEFKDDLMDINMGNIKDLRILLKSTIETIQGNMETCKHLQKQKDEKQKELDDIKLSNNELQNQIKDLIGENQSITNALESNEKLIKDYELQLNDLKKQLLDKTEDKSKTPADAIVKKIMNNLYADVCDKLETARLDNSDKVLSILATAIKQQTMHSLQQLQSGKGE